MIEILPERTPSVLAPLYNEKGITLGENCIAAIAKAGSEVLGYCLFELTEDKLTVFALEPQNDIMLADGILRSALHVGVANEVMTAYYADTAPENLFKKLGFIGEQERSLKVEKLFQSCKGCAK